MWIHVIKQIFGLTVTDDSDLRGSKPDCVKITKKVRLIAVVTNCLPIVIDFCSNDNKSRNILEYDLNMRNIVVYDHE